MERLAKRKDAPAQAADLAVLPMAKREHAHEGATCGDGCGCGESEGDGCCGGS